MPPRHTYWTIIFGNQPTAFRAATRDELLPTLRQIQSRHPDAVMMWFARGRLWHSDEEARAAMAAQRMRSSAPRGGSRPAYGGTATPRREGERRGAAWRPGGAHADPRDRFKVPRDVKRSRFKARQRFKKKDEE